MVKLGQPPINQSQLPLLMVNHDIMGLNIAMHNAARMAKVERFQQLEDVVADVKVGEFRIEYLEVVVVDVLEDEGGGFAEGISDHIEQLDDIDALDES